MVSFAQSRCALGGKTHKTVDPLFCKWKKKCTSAKKLLAPKQSQNCKNEAGRRGGRKTTGVQIIKENNCGHVCCGCRRQRKQALLSALIQDDAGWWRSNCWYPYIRASVVLREGRKWEARDHPPVRRSDDGSRPRGLRVSTGKATTAHAHCWRQVVSGSLNNDRKCWRAGRAACCGQQP